MLSGARASMVVVMEKVGETLADDCEKTRLLLCGRFNIELKQFYHSTNQAATHYSAVYRCDCGVDNVAQITSRHL